MKTETPFMIGGRPFNPLRLLVSAEVRYWEDAEINEVADTEDGTRIPLKIGTLWSPHIELGTGRVLAWPQGITAGSLSSGLCRTSGIR